MKTRKALVTLKDGRTIETTDIPDDAWQEFLRLNERWQNGASGGLDVHFTQPNGQSHTLRLDYADIERIDLWPGSQESMG